MSRDPGGAPRLAGHALRNANLRARSLARARQAPPLARALVTLRARRLGMTRLEFARRSGIGRGTLRDLELGVHTPTRRTLKRFVEFCRSRGVGPAELEEVYRLYAGPEGGLGPLIARLELRAGSPAELARRAGLSPATLWEYRRGNFPLPLETLRRLCRAVGEDGAAAEGPWCEAERARLSARGYPPALAEFWALCGRAGYAEAHLPGLGLGMAALRRLRYLELPAWREVAGAARALCRDDAELRNLERLWREGQGDGGRTPSPFGARLQRLRKERGLSRRDVADLFKVTGRKPARLVQSIEEEGCYSAQAYPAGLAALLARTDEEREQLLGLWEARRRQFHRRHRPETRVDLRLARERYGFGHEDMEPVLGYTPLEYQRIERGVGPLSDPARARILEAVHRAGRRRVEALLQAKAARDAARVAWRSPPSVRELVARLARREGGLLPLARLLRRAGLTGVRAGRLRAIAAGEELPAWPAVEQVARAGDVADLAAVRQDWRERYRARLDGNGCSPLGVEVRLVIAEAATTLREFSGRLGFSPSVLVRDLQRLCGGRPGKWFRVERILRAAGVPADDRRWERIHAWWYAARVGSGPAAVRDGEALPSR
jgi:transcriptional regulator with XRE-family HTH domain